MCYDRSFPLATSHPPAPVSLASALSDPAASRLAVNAPWLVKLRWVAVVGQLATIAFVEWGLDVDLATAPLVACLAVTAATNAVLWWWVRRQATSPAAPRYAPLVIAGVMLLDLLVLTVMLYVTGGNTNPFVVFYFVNLALAGVLLEAPLAWLLEAVAVVGMAVLFWNHWQVPVLSDPERLTALARTDEIPLAALGDFVALVASSGVIVAFMTRLTAELRASEQARSRAEERRARSEKLEALGTLAAGAAHELGTPLSTIAVVATEVERELSGRDLPADVAADLRLVRSELERCRAILDRMALDSGQMIGEQPVELTARQLVESVIEGLSEPERVAIDDRGGADRVLRAPRVAVAQAIRGLVQNGLDVQPLGKVTIAIDAADRAVRLAVIDQGGGMPAEVLSRAGEPFFTTKQPGQGMGLGLFLARSVVERLGGTLQLHSTPGQGTEAVVELPTAE